MLKKQDGDSFKDAGLEKRVRLTTAAYKWLRGKAYVVDSSWIVSVVLWTPYRERRYYDRERNRFLINVRRKVGDRKKTITMRIEETDTEYLVLVLHMEDNWR